MNAILVGIFNPEALVNGASACGAPSRQTEALVKRLDRPYRHDFAVPGSNLHAAISRRYTSLEALMFLYAFGNEAVLAPL